MAKRRPVDGRPLTVAQAWRKAGRSFATPDGRRACEAVESLMGREVGRRREISPSVLLQGIATTAILGRKMEWARVLGTMRELPRALQRHLGIDNGNITYRQVSDFGDKCVAALLLTPACVVTDDPYCTDHDVSALTWFCDRCCEASGDWSLVDSTAYAVDSTDKETWARRQSWNSTPDWDDTVAAIDGPRTGFASGQRPRATAGWPKIGPDGRFQHSKDVDAREGYRAGDNGKPGETFLGYDLHALVAARSSDGPEVPFLVRRIAVAPAGSHKGDAVVPMIERMHADGVDIAELLADLGYLFSDPLRFHHPVRKLGIDLVGDIHPADRGRQIEEDGILFIDDLPFASSLPEAFRDLPAAPRGIKPAQRREYEVPFEVRLAYAFSRHGRPDEQGYQRWIGPARAGRVRCPNYPRSMRLPLTKPLTNCVLGEPCSCAKTITLPPTVLAKTRQRHPWMTGEWFRSKSRRGGASESANATLKSNFTEVERKFIKVFGLAKHLFLLTFAVMGANLDRVRGHCEKHGLTDPFADPAAEPPPNPRRSRQARAKRRDKGYDVLLPREHDPPAGA